MSKKLTVFLLCILVFSCHSTNGMLTKRQDRTVSYLSGKIFDGENKSCPQVTVSLYQDGARTILVGREISDVTGSIYFPPVPFGTYYLEVEKAGYRGIALAVNLELPEQSLYLVMLDGDQILDKAIESLEQDNYSLALGYISDLKSMGREMPYGIYLESIMAWKQGNHGEALFLIDSLIDAGESDPYLLKLRDLVMDGRNGEK